MALNPSAPYDLKSRFEKAHPLALTGEVPYPSSIQPAGPERTPTPPTLGQQVLDATVPIAETVNQGLRHPLGAGLPAFPATATATPAAPAAPVSSAPAPSGLPDGVRATNAAGIYEGRRGLAGERVFSDNAFDPLLTDRSGGMRATTPAAINALANTPGASDARGLREVFDPSSVPGATPQYRFAAPTLALGMREAAARTSPQAAAALNETPDQIAKRIGSNDPAAIGAEIATNKAALANTRYARGAGADSATGLPNFPGVGGAGGINGPLNINDVINLTKTTADIRDREAQTGLALNKEANDRGQKVYDEIYSRTKDLTPQQRQYLSNEDYASLLASSDANATPAMKANANRAVDSILARAFNSTRVPGVGRGNISEQDIGNRDIEVTNLGALGTGLRYATDLNGKALSIEDAKAKEAQGLPVKWNDTNTAFGLNLGSDASAVGNLLNDPTLGPILQRRIAERRAQRKGNNRE